MHKPLKWMKTKLRNEDLFGYYIPLNFNKKGASHTTLIGGCISLIIKMGMLLFILINLIKLVTFDGDEISTVFKKASSNEATYYNGKKELIFWVLKKTGANGFEPLYLNDIHIKPTSD